MKKLSLFLFALLFATLSFGQGRGSVGTVASDDIEGAETVNFYIGQFTGSYNSLAIAALCTNVGGTSDGTLTLYGSNDNSNWVFINGAADGGVVTASPKASITGTDMNQITITNALVASWVVDGVPYRNYRVAGVGTSGDTTTIAITYVYK